MWRAYSSGYIKNNRSSGMSVIIAAFISALLLSLLCGLFYNAWKYEIERIELEEGGWQSRIAWEITKEEIEGIKNFANVKAVVVNEKETENQRTENQKAESQKAESQEAESQEAENQKAESRKTVVDIYFDNMGDVLEDTPRIAGLVGIPPEAVTYNYELLAMYLIRAPQDTAPRLLFPMFLLITAMASFSLIVIIHNSFAVSMNGRIHQLGILSSIGATPGQIRECLLQEAAVLCTVPILAGNLLGIAGSMALLQMVNDLLGSDAAGRHEAVFGYHPFVFVLTLLITVLTIGISAWLPAQRLSRLTPLEAIKNTGEFQLKRKKSSPVLARLFGVEGELAGNALKAQRKALKTASLSLFFSFMAFTVMQCFFATTGISTRETYFERYQDVWDIMVTVKDTEVDAFAETEEIQELPGVKSAVVYQKAAAKRIITEDEMSKEMKSFGGFSHASGRYVTETDGGWLVNAPIFILDDASFLDYCERIGITPRLDGAVIRNKICDVTDPDYRHRLDVPYIKGESSGSVLRQSGSEDITAKIPVLSYTEEVPVLREEYGSLDYYELVHFVPVSLWKEIKGRIGGMEEDTYICILGRENETLEELDLLQAEIEKKAEKSYTIESENRIRQKETNDKQLQGMKAIFGGFCALLALIGIGNVFSNTLGFVNQRKREFARYMSVGLTPGEIKKMFCIEALVLAGRPVLITIPFAVTAVGYLLRASYLEAGEFFAEAPLTPIAVFMLAILGAVASAYCLGWRKVCKINLAEVLRDDTMI